MLSQEEFQQQYEAALCPGDPARVNRYVKSVWIKYQIAYYMQPQHIVELGVRAGYSTWAMHLGCSSAAFTGYDNYAPGNQDKYGHEEELRRHAEELYSHIGGTLIQEDTQTLERLPAADLYHVDAGHRFRAAYKDIITCLGSSASAVTVVHDADATAVKRAIASTVQSCRLLQLKHIASDWGDAVISYAEQPWVRDIVPFDEALVKDD